MGGMGRKDTGFSVSATPGGDLFVAAIKSCWMSLSFRSEPKENHALEDELCQATRFSLQL